MKKELNESISSNVYHFTSVDACIDILESNKFFLTLSYGNDSEEGHDNRLFYMSTTRQTNGYLGYQNYMDYSTRICLDGDKLNNNYKGTPFNYFKKQGKQKHIGSKLHDFSYQQKASFDESEDRVWSYSPTIDNAKRYIKEIDVYSNDNEEIEKLANFANEVTINLYNDPYNFKMKNKNFTVLEYKPTESSEIDYDKMEHSFRIYKYILSYIIGIYCLYNKITSPNTIKELISKFDVASNINDSYEEIEVLEKVNGIISDVYTNKQSIYNIVSMLKGYTEGSGSKTNDAALLLTLFNKFIRQNNLYDKQTLYASVINNVSESKELKTKNIINEALTNTVYHFTSLKTCIKILANDEFMLSFSLTSSNEYFGNRRLFYMSTTRIARGDIGFGSNGNVRLELDGEKLNQRYNAQPVSFFYNKDTKKQSVKASILNMRDFGEKKIHELNESEDRIYSDKPTIPNAKDYIKRIDIYAFLGERMDEMLLQLNKNIGNIDVRIYQERQDFNERNNNYISLKKRLSRKKINDLGINLKSESNNIYKLVFSNWLAIIALTVGKIENGVFTSDLYEIANYLSKNDNTNWVDEAKVKSIINHFITLCKNYEKINLFHELDRVNVKLYEDYRLAELYHNASKVFSRLGLHSQTQINDYIVNRIKNGENR